MSTEVVLSAPSGEALLHRGDVAVLFGPTGACKTRLAIRMLVRLAVGMPWLDGVSSSASGQIAFVSLKDSPEETKRMILEECKWAGVKPSDLRGKIDMFTNEAWGMFIVDTVEPWRLVIIDDAARDGHAGASMEDAQKYILSLRQTVEAANGKPAVVVVQSHVRGTHALLGVADQSFLIDAPTDQFGIAVSGYEPWTVSEYSGGRWSCSFIMTINGIREIRP